MKDREYAESLNAEADMLLEKYNKLADQIFASVEERLR
jgi:formiminotetrahydrofolate cyclodeaminase